MAWSRRIICSTRRCRRCKKPETTLMKPWIRWFVFIPAGVAAYFLVYFAVMLLGFLQNFFMPSLSASKHWFEFLANIWSPMAFVGVGSIIAPRFQTNVAITLCATYNIFAVSMIYVSWAVNLNRGFKFWWLVVCVAIGLGSSIWAVKAVRDKEEEDEAELKRIEEQEENRRKQQLINN